jgi:hypothetical protein
MQSSPQSCSERWTEVKISKIEVDPRSNVCPVCIWGHLRPSCPKWASCVNCRQRGHLGRHCRATWQPTGRKLILQEFCFRRQSNPNEASTKKETCNPLLIDKQTELVAGSTPSVPNTELSLFCRTQPLEGATDFFFFGCSLSEFSADGVSTC